MNSPAIPAAQTSGPAREASRRLQDRFAGSTGRHPPAVICQAIRETVYEDPLTLLDMVAIPGLVPPIESFDSYTVPFLARDLDAACRRMPDADRARLDAQVGRRLGRLPKWLAHGLLGAGPEALTAGAWATSADDPVFQKAMREHGQDPETAELVIIQQPEPKLRRDIVAAITALSPAYERDPAPLQRALRSRPDSTWRDVADGLICRTSGPQRLQDLPKRLTPKVLSDVAGRILDDPEQALQLLAIGGLEHADNVHEDVVRLLMAADPLRRREIVLDQQQMMPARRCATISQACADPIVDRHIWTRVDASEIRDAMSCQALAEACLRTPDLGGILIADQISFRDQVSIDDAQDWMRIIRRGARRLDPAATIAPLAGWLMRGCDPGEGQIRCTAALCADPVSQAAVTLLRLVWHPSTEEVLHHHLLLDQHLAVPLLAQRTDLFREHLMQAVAAHPDVRNAAAQFLADRMAAGDGLAPILLSRLAPA